jgi:hypothetical protein
MVSRTQRQAAFAIYACLLFIATHWPALTIPLKGRWDLPVHAAVFGTWCALFTSLGVFGTPASRRNVLRSALVATVYAAVDESLQAIPAIHRTAAWDDFGANCLGVWLVAVAILVGRTRTPFLQDSP